MDRELNETLIELIVGVYQSDEEMPLSVESIEISAPVTVRLRWSETGVSLLASPPVTSYRTGIEPVVHPLRLVAIESSTKASSTSDSVLLTEGISHGWAS